MNRSVSSPSVPDYAGRSALPRRPPRSIGSSLAGWLIFPLVVALLLLMTACTRPADSEAPPASSPVAGAPSGAQPPQQMTVVAPTPTAGAFPVTVTDSLGNTITLTEAPQRIVSLAPSHTEVLYALGLGDKVVAVSKFSDYPEEAKTRPQIDALKPSIEALIALEPDLVLGVGGVPDEVRAGLARLSVAVAIWDAKDFSDVLEHIELTGRLTGRTEVAQRLTAGMRERWQTIEAKARTATTKPRVLYEVDATDPAKPWVAGPGNFIDAMITAAGGVNIAATAQQQWPQLSLEVVVQADPEIIILGDAQFGVTVGSIAGRPGWGAITAVTRNAIYPVLDSNLTSRAGPRIVDGLEVIARAVHPELFGAPQPGASSG